MQAPTPSPETIEKLADGLAKVQDFRLLFYVLILVLILMVLERWTASAGMRKEREQMWAVADKFTEAAKEYSSNTDKLVVELQVLRALTARVEANVTPPGRS